MYSFGWVLLFLSAMFVLSYHRASLVIWFISALLLYTFLTYFHGLTWGVMFFGVLLLFFFLPLLIIPLRKQFITKPLFNFYLSIMPSMSKTEREAISAGTVTWEGDLFRGAPDWDKFLSFAPPKLTEEEQLFIDGPVDRLCQMTNDWEISHNTGDLSPEIWRFLKEHGFFGLIIPKAYGGKQFSAYAHSQILTKVSGRSITLSTTITVPNSLGPAELLLHYGTETQKNYYLPRLAKGEEIPCFALTSPEAGSDAGSMTDHGIICNGYYQGESVIGIRLNFNKRYITLAPIATVIGLAFKLYDPDHLIGKKEEIGITCALIPRNTFGVVIGRRHLPLDTPFQNGPVQGKDVFIPLDFIIGGVQQAGKGWVMLMECLAAGRSISLPASALGGAKVLSYTTGAYARIRRQFNLPIGRFEGIEEPLARIGVYTMLMDAARSFAAASIDNGEKPSVASAIVKYHVTEMGRVLSCDGMDIHGGKGICLGPNNYIGRGYEATPIAITVEGANILTRNLIIFGQGAIRCHPYVLAEMEAAKIQDKKAALRAFDRIIIKHIAYGFSNLFRSLLLGLSGAQLVMAPKGSMKRYFQNITRFSSALALMSDVSMLVFGGTLKRKESISARLGDILSYLYILSATLKQHYDNGQPEDDLPIIHFAGHHCLYQIQLRFDELFKNYPNRFLAILLKLIIFPLGYVFKKPMDKYNHKIAQLLIAPTATRERLAKGAFLTVCPENILSDLQTALLKTIIAEPIEKTIRTAKHDGLISGYTRFEMTQQALDRKIITQEEFNAVIEATEARNKIIAVDDFSSEELARHTKQDQPFYAKTKDEGE